MVLSACDQAARHYEQGYAHEQKGMRAHAMREYRAALEQRPDHPDALLRLAALYGEEKQYDRALGIYIEFLQFYPESVQARFLLGNVYAESQRYEEAISTYEEIASLQPQWAALWGRLGQAYSIAGRLEHAAEAYRRSLKNHPDSSAVRYGLALLYQKQGHFEAALEEYRILLENAPENHEFHTHLANILIHREEKSREDIYLDQTPAIAEAEEHLRRALQLKTESVHGRWSLGLLLARQKRYGEAITQFKKILELDPEDYQAHHYLGNLYERAGKEEEAGQHFAIYARAERGQRFQKTARTEFEKHVQKTLEKLAPPKSSTR